MSRSKSGILVIDKPKGLSSFDIVRQVRRWCGTRRVGHAGTLDPLATGVLPVAVGRATRLVEYMMAGDKVYQATLKLGAATDTQDAEGQVLETKAWSHVDRVMLDQVIPGFVGKIEQVPPMYSALKKDGQPLYKLARQGIEVERKSRSVQVASLVIDDFSPPELTFTVHCSKGTYVRTLCHDLGQTLGCGAHMTALRRLACGQFDIDASYTIEDVQALVDSGEAPPLLPPAEALADWPAIDVPAAALGRLQDGVAPDVTEVDASGLVAEDMVCLMAKARLVAVARFVPGGYGKRPGDFELIKVFPTEEDDV